MVKYVKSNMIPPLGQVSIRVEFLLYIIMIEIMPFTPHWFLYKTYVGIVIVDTNAYSSCMTNLEWKKVKGFICSFPSSVPYSWFASQSSYFVLKFAVLGFLRAFITETVILLCSIDDELAALVYLTFCIGLTYVFHLSKRI